MAVLNLRNVPEKLKRELRARAAMAGMGFHSFCLQILEQGLDLIAEDAEEKKMMRHFAPLKTLAPAPAHALQNTESLYRDTTMGQAAMPVPAGDDFEIEIT